MNLRAGEEFRLRIDPIDLDATLGCGQTFRWDREPDGHWIGVLGHDICRVGAHRGVVSVESLTGCARPQDVVGRYLRKDDDISEIQRALATDDIISRGFPRLRGLRLVKMDEWECLISYALATYANIPRIRRMIDSLCSSFGERIQGEVRAFPSVDELGRATVEDLASCGLGYRARYVRGICESVDGGALKEMRRMRYPQLRRRLKELPGVGDKVADCVALFGFGKLEAFPIDVWMQRALLRLYDVKGSYASLSEFARERFGEYAGYAQEYLYYNERTLASGEGCALSQQAH